MDEMIRWHGIQQILGVSHKRDIQLQVKPKVTSYTGVLDLPPLATVRIGIGQEEIILDILGVGSYVLDSELIKKLFCVQALLNIK